jgi:hypothetical protein
MDPVTISLAMGVASKAFDAIKKGFAVGRDIEQMSGDIGRWMGAVSDVDNAEKQAKNPPLFGKLFKAGSIEEAALSAYAAKKKLEEQRYELKMFLNFTYGPQAYDDLLKMEGQIRKERQQTIYKQQQLRRQIGEAITWLIVVAIIGGFCVLVAGIWMKKARAENYIQMTEGYKFKPRDYTNQQKIWQGKKKQLSIQLVDLKRELHQSIQTKKVVSIKEGTKLLHC